jgi:ribose 5-phosphate isomerase B
MKIAIGSDHAGFTYKEKIKKFLTDKGHTVDDFGTDSEKSVDYPLFIFPVAKAVSDGKYPRGIVLGGSGNGEAMAANRVHGIRCALCWNRETARLARSHNNANMLSLGARMISIEQALEIVDTWLETPFDKGRHLRRIKLIDEPYQAVADTAGRHAEKNTPSEKSTMGEHQKGMGKPGKYDLLISFRFIKYMEGENSLELEVEPSMIKPTVVHVPSEKTWDETFPAWAAGRRTEILDRIKPKCSHLDWDWKEY